MGKITLSFIVGILFWVTINTQLHAQDIWWNTATNPYAAAKINKENQYDTFEINANALKGVLDQVPGKSYYNTSKANSLVGFPNDKNGVTYYRVSKTEVMHPELANKYPEIRTFVGVSVEDARETIRFVYNRNVGLQGAITKPGKSTLIIKPINTSTHVLYASKSEVSDTIFDCKTEELSNKIAKKGAFSSKNANDGNLRRYRLALSVSGNYSQYFLDGTETSDVERKTKVLTAMISSMNRVNGIFERDFGVTMQIIPESDSLIYLDPASDPYTTGGALNGQLQNTLDTNPNVGTLAYDVGHLFHVENAVYGNAGCIACVCTNGSKGSAFTTHVDPASDNFNLIVAHEFGHQFGGYHVQSSSICRSGVNSEVEPGSGSSIMGYAGICSPNVQNAPDDYFNYVDIRDVAIWTINDSSCAEIIPTGNTAPIVDAGVDHIIPRSTPFVLDGTAMDIDGEENLTYCWEQNNPEDPFSSNTPQSNWVNGPLFRSRQPSASPKRYMPQLDDILSGNLSPTWEVLPSVSRSMRFELTVRDNVPEGGQTNTDGILVTVDAGAGPFTVTSQLESAVWNVGEQVTVNWDVANTNQAPISAANVDILLSVDGGYTYPYILQDDTPNDGTATFVLPNAEGSTTARVMVKASDNIFFAVNNTNFTVQVSDFIITPDANSVAICQSENAVYTIDYRTFLDFDEEVVFSADNLPSGAQINFSPPSISGSQLNGTPIEATISGTSDVAVGLYDISVTGAASSGIDKEVTLQLEVFNATIGASNLVFPTNNLIGFDLNTSFEWSSDINTETYEIQIATDISFLNIIESEIVSENNFVAELLNYDSSYFWRIKNSNQCGSSDFSTANSFSTGCATPESFESTGRGSSFVALNWIDENSTVWEIEYGLSGFEIGNGTTLVASTNPYIVSGLNSLTAYDFYLRSTCTVGEVGTALGPISVTTTQDFCGGDRFYDSGGADGNYSNNENETTVIAPETSGDRVRAVFESFSLESCCDDLSIYDGPDTASPFLGSYRGNNLPPELVSSHETGALTFVFRSDGSVTFSGWDARIVCEPKPNCDKPSGFIVSTIVATSATLNWNTDNQSSSWDLEYGLQGFARGTGTIITSAEANATLNALNSKTFYDVYIIGNCLEGGNSDVVGPLTFETLCDTVLAPFSESFGEFGVTPACWVESGVGTWNYNLFADYDAAQAGDRNVLRNTNYAWVDGSFPNGENEVSILTTPFVDISELAVPSIQFSVFSKNTIDNSYNLLEVEFYDGASWNVILSLQENTGGWRDIAINLENYTITGPIQTRFTVTENSIGNSEFNDILIDEIEIDEMPSCQNPYQLEVSEIRGRSAVVSWTSSGTETNWELQYGLQGFTPATAINEVVTTNPYEITGLEPTTTYELYIRALCGIGDTSDFIGPILFTTGCDAYIAPFAENYTSFGRPECWEEQSNVNWNFGLFFDNILQTQIPDRTQGLATNYAWKFNGFDNLQTPSYLITPYVNVSSLTTPSIQFSLYSNTITNANYNTLTVEFFDGVTWNTLLTFAESTIGWKEYYFDISSYTITDDIQVRFGILENTNSAEYNYILIDDVKVDELPSCFNPSALSVDAINSNSATISWIPGNTETNWQIQYGASGFVLDTGDVIDTTNNPETIPNLVTGTTYDVYLRAACDTSDISDWIGPIFLKIPADFCNGDRFYDSGGANGNYSNNENETTLISPQNAGDRVRVLFESFSLESCCDSLTVYDGPDTASPFLGSYSGNNLPPELVSSHETGALTFIFRSDGSVVSSGWDARVICEPNPNCDAPDNILISDVLSDQATVSWTTTTGETNWELEYGFSGFSQGSGTKVTATSSTYNITGLASDTSYDFYIKAICDAGGFSDAVGPFSFRTQVSCPAPTGFIVNSVTNNTANLAWDITGGNELNWELEYGFDGFVQGTGNLVQSETNSIAISDLESSMNYDVYLRANCDENDMSAWTGPFNFRTSCDLISGDPNEYIQNGSFECGDLGSWRSIGPGGISGCNMNFTVLENSSTVCVIVPEVAPSEGQFAAYTSFDGNAGDTYILEQTISLPADLSSDYIALVSFDFRVEYNITFGTPTAERTLNVDLYDAANNFIMSVDEQSFGINPLTGSIDVSVSREIINGIINFGGQDVILRFSAFIPDTTTGPAKAMIDNVSFRIQNVLSTGEEELLSSDILLYPNPNEGDFILNYQGKNVLDKIQIFDLTGKIVFEELLSGFNKQKNITLYNAQSGIYLVKVISDQATITKRIIIE